MGGGEGTGAQLHSFLIPALDDGGWSASRPDRCTPRYSLSRRLGMASESVWTF